MEQIERKPSEETYRSKVVESLEKAGASNIEEAIIDRLVLLERYSRFNEDSRMIERATQRILIVLERQYSGEFPNLKFSKEQKKEASVASLLHDIGKSGPASASPEQQMAVVRLFAAEGLKNPQQKIEDAVGEIFGGEAKNLLNNLVSVGVDSSMTMREFYDLHANWTKEILEANPGGVSEKVRIIAATHHIDRGINPYGVPEEEAPVESLAIGAAEYYVEALEKRVLMAADKYQAAIRRGGRSHEQAMNVVREILGEKYTGDKTMQMVLGAIDTLGGSGDIFKENSFNT